VKIFQTIFLFAATFITHAVIAADSPKPNTDFEYPELMVAPSASDRLQLQAKSENSNRYTDHWAIQTSAATTLIAAILSGSDPGKETTTDDTKPKATKTASTAGIAIGGHAASAR
jgi:hypothetical protein